MNQLLYNLIFVWLIIFMALLLGCGPKNIEVAPYYCSTERLENGVKLFCTDGTETVIYDGEDGIDGINGIDGIDGINAVAETIDPCGDYPNHYDEILLRFTNGLIVVILKEGGKYYMSYLEPGNYITTDKQQCYFTVTEDMEVTW